MTAAAAAENVQRKHKILLTSVKERFSEKVYFHLIFPFGILTNAYKRRIIINRGGLCLKRRELIKLLEENGWIFGGNESNHDVYVKGNETEAIPRHTEINENLAKAIIRRRNLK